MNGFDLENGFVIDKIEGNLKIIYDDVKEKIDFWLNAVVCYVLETNFSLQVMEGFFRRICGKFGID